MRDYIRQVPTRSSESAGLTTIAIMLTLSVDVDSQGVAD